MDRAGRRSGAPAAGRGDEFRDLGLLFDRRIVAAWCRASVLEKRHPVETGFRFLMVAIPITITIAIVLPALALTPIALAIAAAVAAFTLAAFTLAVFTLAIVGGTRFGGALFGGSLVTPLAGLGIASSVAGLGPALAVLRLAGLLTLLPGLSLLLAVLATLAPVVALDEAAHGLDHAVIVVGVLEIGFGEDAIAGRGRLAGQRLVLVEDLMGIAADPDVGTATIENLVSIGGTAGTVMLRLVMVTATTAATTATAARPLTIVWSH